jgi:hypothetical protein
MGLQRKGFDDLQRETHPEGYGPGGEGSERAVVVTAAASEAPAAGGKGESRDEETVERSEADPLALDGFLESAACVWRRAKLPGRGSCAPEEGRAMEAWKDKTLCGVFQKGQEVGLFRERGEQGHGRGDGPGGMAPDLGKERAGAFLPEG